MQTATPIMTMLALEHLRAVAESCEDAIQGVAEGRIAMGDTTALERIEGGCMDLARQLGQPHLPGQRIGVLRRVGTEAAVMAFGMSYRSGDTMDGLAQRMWYDARQDIEGCMPTLLAADHHGIMGSVRDTLLAWRKSFAQTKHIGDATAKREIESMRCPLLAVAAVCLLSAATDITDEGQRPDLLSKN